MKTYRIAAIPGDGIGIEVVAAGLRVLEALAERDGGFELDVTQFDWGSERYKREGALMPEDGADAAARLRRHLLRRGRRARRARPPDALGAAARDLPAARPVRERPPDADPARAFEAPCGTSGRATSTG